MQELSFMVIRGGLNIYVLVCVRAVQFTDAR